MQKSARLVLFPTAVIALLSVFLFTFGCFGQSPAVVQNNTSVTQNNTSITPPNPTDNGSGIVVPNDTGIPDNQTITDNSSINATGNQTSGENDSSIVPNDTGSIFPLRPTVYKSQDDLVSTSNYSYAYEPYTNLTLYFFNVGYSESILVKKGDFNMLVDTGQSSTFPGIAVILRNIGVDRIHVLVATHSRDSFIEAMPQAMGEFDVEDLWNNNVTSASVDYDAMINAAAQKKVLIKHPTAGDVLAVNGMNITVLNPQAPRYGNVPDDTDSIVLQVKYKDFCAILMSDAETGIENQIMGKFSNLNCPVMLIGHNGAGTATQASTILLRVNPKVAVISVGQNPDGNPKSTVLELLKLNNIEIYRTDVDGNIMIQSDGSKNFTISQNQ